MTVLGVRKHAYQYGVIGLTVVVLLLELVSFSSTGWMRFEGTSGAGEGRVSGSRVRNRRFIPPPGLFDKTTPNNGSPIGSGSNIGREVQNQNTKDNNVSPSQRPVNNDRQRPSQQSSNSNYNGGSPQRPPSNDQQHPSKKPSNSNYNGGSPQRPPSDDQQRPSKKPSNSNYNGGSPQKPPSDDQQRPSKKPSNSNYNGGSPQKPPSDDQQRPSKKPSNSNYNGGSPHKPSNNNNVPNRPLLNDKFGKSRQNVTKPSPNQEQSSEPPKRLTWRPPITRQTDARQTPPSFPFKIEPRNTTRAPDGNRIPRRPGGFSSPNLNDIDKFTNFIADKYNSSWTIKETIQFIKLTAQQRNVALPKRIDAVLQQVIRQYKNRNTSTQSKSMLQAILKKVFSSSSSGKFKVPGTPNTNKLERADSTNADKVTSRGNSNGNTITPSADKNRSPSDLSSGGTNGANAAQSGGDDQEHAGQWESVDIGLWAVVVCQENLLDGEKSCRRTDSVFSSQGSFSISMTDVQVEAVFAIMFGLIGSVSTVLLVVPSCLEDKKRLLLIFGICGLIVSGLLYVISIARAIGINSAAKEQADREYGSFNMKTPWCLVVGGIGAGLAFVTSGILATSKWVENRKEWKEFSDEVVFTNGAYDKPSSEVTDDTPVYNTA